MTAKITKKDSTKSATNKQERTINGFTKEYEEMILQEEREMEEEFKNGTARLFKSHAEFEEAIKNGEI